ncbi:helix-turn-helix transcriptional regulator [Alteromonas macleodii]|jgi:prophage regulatory protein|uniref:helix-turn-helix transcriptional regulator n=1 Tax=Alteromonas macleodii TaxID=28108 RepID=UPI003140A792
MTHIPHLKILRKSEVAETLGISLSGVREKTVHGLLPPFISLGPKKIGYLSHEIQAVISALSVGQGDEEIRKLISELVGKRKQYSEAITQSLFRPVGAEL